MPHAARQPRSWLIFDVGRIRSYAAQSFRDDLEGEGNWHRCHCARSKGSFGGECDRRFDRTERKGVRTFDSGAALARVALLEERSCRRGRIRDETSSVFSRQRCRAPYAQQVARANAWSRHAACYRREKRNGDADPVSSCRTRRAGSTRGSSLTLGKIAPLDMAPFIAMLGLGVPEFVVIAVILLCILVVRRGEH